MESEPVAAAKNANSEHGIRVFCIGLGDEESGAKVPARAKGRFVRHDGVEVRSKLNGEILRQVADASGGAYIPAGTKRVDMAQVYHGYIARVDQGEFASARINTFEARFQWFLGPAILLLLLQCWWSSRGQSSRADERQDANAQVDSRGGSSKKPSVDSVRKNVEGFRGATAGKSNAQRAARPPGHSHGQSTTQWIEQQV